METRAALHIIIKKDIPCVLPPRLRSRQWHHSAGLRNRRSRCMRLRARIRAGRRKADRDHSRLHTGNYPSGANNKPLSLVRIARREARGATPTLGRWLSCAVTVLRVYIMYSCVYRYIVVREIGFSRCLHRRERLVCVFMHARCNYAGNV